MKTQIVKGQQVKLRSAQGDITRVVVDVLGEIVLICRLDEYSKAQREGRAPVAVGFKLADVLY